MEFQFDRSHPAFFSTQLNAQQLEKVRLFVQTENQRLRKAHDAIQMDEFINAVDKTISPLSDKMVAKNGAILFVRMPETGELWNASSRRYPKDLYWDEFARRCNAPAIHFTDFPELSKFECPDGAHLDYPDAMEFTKNLSDIIKEHGYLP